MKKFGLILTLFVFIFTNSAYAEMHPSRVRMLVHGAKEINKVFDLKADFIPSGNLLATPLYPITYFGTDIKLVRWLTLQLTIGYLFGNDEFIISPRLGFKTHNFYIWAMFDIRPQTKGSYWFAQAEYCLCKWLHFGFEEESWGDFDEWKNFSHGGGPNILFRWGIFGLDMAVHGRKMGGNFGPEFFARVHLFLPKI